MRTEVGVRPDVGGIQHRQGALTGDGASALVGVGHQQADAPWPSRGCTRIGLPYRCSATASSIGSCLASASGTWLQIRAQLGSSAVQQELGHGANEHLRRRRRRFVALILQHHSLHVWKRRLEGIGDV